MILLIKDFSTPLRYARNDRKYFCSFCVKKNRGRTEFPLFLREKIAEEQNFRSFCVKKIAEEQNLRSFCVKKSRKNRISALSA